MPHVMGGKMNEEKGATPITPTRATQNENRSLGSYDRRPREEPRQSKVLTRPPQVFSSPQPQVSCNTTTNPTS